MVRWTVREVAERMGITSANQLRVQAGHAETAYKLWEGSATRVDMEMPLTADSLRWAIEFVQKHADGDLFPRILEVDAICRNRRRVCKGDRRKRSPGIQTWFVSPFHRSEG